MMAFAVIVPAGVSIRTPVPDQSMRVTGVDSLTGRFAGMARHQGAVAVLHGEVTAFAVIAGIVERRAVLRLVRGDLREGADAQGVPGIGGIHEAGTGDVAAIVTGLLEARDGTHEAFGCRVQLGWSGPPAASGEKRPVRPVDIARVTDLERIGDRRERILRCGVQPVCAVVEGDAGKTLRIGEGAAADAAAGFEHDEAPCRPA